MDELKSDVITKDEYFEWKLNWPQTVNPAVLKKWATGDGHATKTQMVAACKDRYGIVPVDDNAADACHLFYYYIRRHRL